MVKNKCYVFLAASFLTCLLLVPRHFLTGTATVSDRMALPYTYGTPTDEVVTERVLQTHLPAGTAGYTSWHVTETPSEIASPHLPSQVKHGPRRARMLSKDRISHHRIKQNDSIMPRSQKGVPESNQNDNIWLSRQEYLPENNASQSDNISLRSQFQKSAMDHYCSLYYERHFKHRFYKNYHLLSDKNHHVIFCFLPKVGCTNLKIVFFVNQGLLPITELDKPRENLDKVKLRSALRKSHQQNNGLDSYFKFMMVRNPLERLLSAYRDKVEKYSRNFSVTTDPHFEWLRKDIFKRSHPELYMQWVEDGMKPVQNSFYDFINYWLNPGGSKIAHNDHFSPMVDVCKPCNVRYDFYGNFNHFDRDSQVLVDRIGGSSSDLRQGYYSEDSSTDQRKNIYYSTLTETQRIAVVKKLSLDLEFYYTLFPEERDSHKQILNVTCDLKLPHRF